MKFYTIGYGGRMPQEFLDLFKQRGVKVVVDVLELRYKDQR